MAKLKLPRGLRNNNPGNIRKTKPLTPWQGALKVPQPDPEFVSFDTMTNGIRALAVTLITYQDKRRAADGSAIDTVREFISRWAPPNENNTESYVKAVAKKMGVGPDDTIDVHEYKYLRPMVEAIILHENGINPLTSAEIDAGLADAGVQPPPPAPIQSRTMKGSVLATTTLSTASEFDSIREQLSPFVDVVPWLKYVLIAIGLGSLAWIVYARWDDYRRKNR